MLWFDGVDLRRDQGQLHGRCAQGDRLYGAAATVARGWLQVAAVVAARVRAAARRAGRDGRRAETGGGQDSKIPRRGQRCSLASRLSIWGSCRHPGDLPERGGLLDYRDSFPGYRWRRIFLQPAPIFEVQGLFLQATAAVSLILG